MLGFHRFLARTAMGTILTILVSSCGGLKEKEQCDRLTKYLNEAESISFSISNRSFNESRPVFLLSDSTPNYIDRIKSESQISKTIEEIKLEVTPVAEVLDELAKESKTLSNNIAAIELQTKNQSIIKARNYYVKLSDKRTDKIYEMRQIILRLKTIESSSMGLNTWQKTFDEVQKIYDYIYDMNSELITTRTAINWYCRGYKDGEFNINRKSEFFP